MRDGGPGFLGLRPRGRPLCFSDSITHEFDHSVAVMLGINALMVLMDHYIEDESNSPLRSIAMPFLNSDRIGQFSRNELSKVNKLLSISKSGLTAFEDLTKLYHSADDLILAKSIKSCVAPKTYALEKALNETSKVEDVADANRFMRTMSSLIWSMSPEEIKVILGIMSVGNTIYVNYGCDFHRAVIRGELFRFGHALSFSYDFVLRGVSFSPLPPALDLLFCLHGFDLFRYNSFVTCFSGFIREIYLREEHPLLLR
jgi:hypothetical protein